MATQNPLTVLDQLRRRLRTQHYSYRTECSYADWARRFAYISERQGMPHPRIDSESVLRDYLTHLAVQRRVSASTQNQALSAILFVDSLFPYRNQLFAKRGSQG